MKNKGQDAQMQTLQRIIETLSAQLDAQSSQFTAQLAALAPQWPPHSIGELLEEAFKTHWQRAKGRPWLRWAFDKHLLPGLGALQLKDFTPKEAETFFRQFSDRRTLHNRLRATMRCAWSKAREWNWVPSVAQDPFVAVKQFHEEPRERYLSDAERAAWEHARAEVEAGAGKLSTRSACRALRLALLCAFRPAEAFRLRRDAVDFEKRTATLADHKTATKTGKHVVALPRQAVELLQNTPEVPGNPYFFPGRVPGEPIANVTKIFKAICKRAGMNPSEIQIRDLRRTWASTAIERGVNLKAISLQLGHASTEVTAKHYAHMGVKKQAAVAERMGDL